MRTSRASVPLSPRYRELRRSLARLGYISQGSVLDRTTLSRPRRGYQWTRKVGQKTITVALSRDQYQALKQAVDNARTLWKTVAEMERVSRQVLFEALPDTRRRKRLSKKVFGLIEAPFGTPLTAPVLPTLPDRGGRRREIRCSRVCRCGHG